MYASSLSTKRARLFGVHGRKKQSLVDTVVIAADIYCLDCHSFKI
jgi:hypothetical protein